VAEDNSLSLFLGSIVVILDVYFIFGMMSKIEMEFYELWYTIPFDLSEEQKQMDFEVWELFGD
jgi:hypothetical protein